MPGVRQCEGTTLAVLNTSVDASMDRTRAMFVLSYYADLYGIWYSRPRLNAYMLPALLAIDLLHVGQ